MSLNVSLKIVDVNVFHRTKVDYRLSIFSYFRWVMDFFGLP